MKIFDYDESIFLEEAMEETEKLVSEANEIRTNTEQFDEEINLAGLELERCKRVHARNDVIQNAAIAYQKGLQKKLNIKLQSEQRRDEIFRRLGEINDPVIHYLSECVLVALDRLKGAIIFHYEKTDTSMWTDAKTARVKLNQDLISNVRGALLNFRSRIQSLSHSPLKEIKDEAEAISERVNAVDFKKTEVVNMLPSQVKDFEEALKGTPSSPTPPPFVPKIDSKGDDYFSGGIWARVNELKKQFGI